MPNWCQNTVVINAPKSVIDEIKAVLAGNGELLNWMRPIPQDQKDNWYDWCITNWGTKWDISQAFVSDDVEDDSITFSFDTAWSPPCDAFQYWAEQDGRVTYRLSFVETGIGFVGRDSYDGEFLDREYVEHDDDIDGYWEMAEQEFGIERDEDPEPLTEWYVQGVEDKGLEK